MIAITFIGKLRLLNMEDHAALGVDPLVLDRNVIESGSLDAGSDIGSAFLIEIGIHSDIHSVLVFQLDMGAPWSDPPESPQK